MTDVSEHSQAMHIANRWLDFKMNPLVQMVPGDPDCDACVLARQFIWTEEALAIFMRSNGELTTEIARLRQQLEGKDDVRRLVEVDLSELARLRREKEALVEALTTVVTWFSGGAFFNSEPWLAKARAALRSATETKDGPT